MAVCSGQDGSAGGRADAVVDITVVEAHAFFGQAVKVWSVVYASTVAGERFGGVVVGHDEDDVWAGIRRCHFGRHSNLKVEWLPDLILICF